MLILLTPSKTMDVESPLPLAITPTKPLFAQQSNRIRRAMSALKPADLLQVMKMSATLAEKTWKQYQVTDVATKPALWAYVGDVYRGVRAATLSPEDAAWAQSHVVIASGLYGLLRPYDAITLYRLEMRANVAVDDAVNLYDFWGSTLADYVASREHETFVVLCSEEYARAVTRGLTTDIAICTPKFFDTKPDGTVGQVPIYSKQMRGVMARWMIDNRIEDAQKLSEFSEQGYVYDEHRSVPSAPAFTRTVMRPLDLPVRSQLQNTDR